MLRSDCGGGGIAEWKSATSHSIQYDIWKHLTLKSEDKLYNTAALNHLPRKRHWRDRNKSSIMSANLLRHQAIMSPSEAIDASQQAPNLLRKFSSWSLPYPLSLLFNSDAPEKWTIHENLFYTCLRTGDHRSASQCLTRLRDRFGKDNERVMVMTGLYHEAKADEAGDEKELETLLKEYEEAIEVLPVNMLLRKRRVALLKSMSRLSEATTALVELLDISPIDPEAWAELAELYFAQNMYAQAIYSMEEVLLCMPHAWNVS